MIDKPATTLPFCAQFSRFREMGFLWRLVKLWCFCCLLGSGFVSWGSDSGQVKKVIHQYALTSANDFPQRDPQNWRLLGSNDRGKTWTMLDERENQFFQERHERKLYKIDNNNAYETYRLQIDRIRDPSVAISVQLAEVEPMGLTEDDIDPVPAFNDVITTQGDNPPAEVVANLFDGRVETKWMGWLSNSVSRISWVQWQYAAPTEEVITNISHLLALRARANDGYRVQIKAVSAGAIGDGDKICFVDSTGTIVLGGMEGAKQLGTGQTVLITGTSEWAGNRVGIKGGLARDRGPGADAVLKEILLEQPLPPGEDLKRVEVNGQIQYGRLTEGEFSFDLQDDGLSMRVHLLFPESNYSLPREGTPVSVCGICMGAFNKEGQWVAATLYAAGWKSLTVLDPKKRLSAAHPVQTHPLPINSTVLASIEQVRQLAQEHTTNHPHVKIRGVVTGLLGGFIQDESAGIQVGFPVEESRKITELGAYIEVDGTVEVGDGGNPMISADHITVLGRGKLPQPQRLSLSQLMSGRVDAQWIEVEGVVRSTDGTHLLIISDGQELTATVEVGEAVLVNKLVDAKVRLRGVGVTSMDNQGRIQGIHVLIPSLAHVDVVEAPRNPATLPVRPIGGLLGLGEPRKGFHRVKVEGVVTLQDNQKLFLQDETGSAMAIFKEDIVLDARFGHSRWLYWQTRRPSIISKPSHPKFLPGDRIQVVGFLETRRYSPVLTEVTINRIGRLEEPKPVEITSNGIEEGGLDSSLVTLEGVLRGQNVIGANIFLALEWEGRTIQVIVPGNNSGDLLTIDLGSKLRVTGVCQIDPAPYAELGLRVGAVRVQARSAKDLEVLARPPWWTIGRALTLMGGIGFVLVAALVWIKQLRRQVDERTVQLTAEIQLRERTERHHALEEERARIAKDLHDDLGANLTRIVFLSQRVEAASHDNQEATHWFNLIPATARRTIQSLDEIVWAINPRHDSMESLANYLSQFAQEHLTLAGVRCVLDIPMVLPSVPLSAEVRHNILLTTREVLQNAVTHAKATEVNLSLKLKDDAVIIIITDNGKGFDQDSISGDGNGLSNMRRRLDDIGGRLEINSRPGQGTTVSLFVPHEVLHGRVIGGN